MNRRDLLKWFSAGAVAVPIVGGMPKPEAAALIVHQPVVEAPPPPKIHTADAMNELMDGFMSREICEVSVYIRRKGRPYSVRLNCNAYLSKLNIIQDRSMVDVSTYEDKFRRFIPALVNTRFECTGEPELIEGGK